MPGEPMTEEERKKAQADAEKQIQEMQKQPPVLVDFAVYFEDWRDADGVKFPFKMRRAMAGTTTEEWTVNRRSRSTRRSTRSGSPARARERAP